MGEKARRGPGIAAQLGALRARSAPACACWIGVLLGVLSLATIAFVGLFGWLLWIGLTSLGMLFYKRPPVALRHCEPLGGGVYFPRQPAGASLSRSEGVARKRSGPRTPAAREFGWILLPGPTSHYRDSVWEPRVLSVVVVGSFAACGE
jgi:hypothetical protein